MKRIFAFIAISLLMVGCQKGSQVGFENSLLAKGDSSLAGFEGDLDNIQEPIVEDPGESEEDLDNNQDPVVENPGEDGDGDPDNNQDPIVDNPGEEGDDEEVDPINCSGFQDDKVATSNECLKAIADIHQILLLDDGASVKNFSGNFKGKSGYVASIENTKGNLLLVGIGNAYIDKIVDTKGNLTICNMDVGAVESVSAGNIHIDGGNVCKISGHKGNVQVNNGSVVEVSNNKGNIGVTNGRIDKVDSNKGNIKVINGNIGDVNAHTGNVHVKNGTITGTVTNSIGNIKID